MAKKKAKKAKKTAKKLKRSAKGGKAVKKLKKRKPAKKKVAKKKVIKKAKRVKKTKRVKKVKPAKKVKVKKPAVAKPPKKMIDVSKQKPVGEITHYYGKIKVGVIEIAPGEQINVGETLYYQGHTTDFTDVLSSMQEYGKAIEVAAGKKQVGVKVKGKVRQGDKVFRVVPVK